MYLLVSLILQSFFKKILELIQIYEDKHHFRDQNGPFVLNKNFLVQTIVITFIYLLALFIVQNLKKFLQRIQNYDDAPFLGPNQSICPKFFFEKLLLSFSSTYQSLSLCKIFKKFFQQIQSCEDVQFLVPKWPISPNDNFFRKPVNELCFFYSCLLHARY